MEESSIGKLLLAIVVCTLLVFVIFYPHQVWFLARFVGDVIAQNVRPLIQRFFPSTPH